MAQTALSMRSEIASLKKAKLEAEYKIEELNDQLQEKEDEATSHEDWPLEKASLELKVENIQDQLSHAQQQVHRFMDAFNRETELRKAVKSKLETQEKFNVKLSKNLRRKSEELKEELRRGRRERYKELAGAVRRLFEFKQMDAMSGEAFGDVGRALKRVKDLVADEG
jgi:chromosome segregation ATPase